MFEEDGIFFDLYVLILLFSYIGVLGKSLYVNIYFILRLVLLLRFINSKEKNVGYKIVCVYIEVINIYFYFCWLEREEGGCYYCNYWRNDRVIE